MSKQIRVCKLKTRTRRYYDYNGKKDDEDGGGQNNNAKKDTGEDIRDKKRATGFEERGSKEKVKGERKEKEDGEEEEEECVIGM